MELVQASTHLLDSSPLKGISKGLVYYFHTGRNAWNSTWVTQYANGCMHTTLKIKGSDPFVSSNLKVMTLKIRGLVPTEERISTFIIKGSDPFVWYFYKRARSLCFEWIQKPLENLCSFNDISIAYKG